MALYDVYKLSPGVYRYVGPYAADDHAAHALSEASDQYVVTVNNLKEAAAAATDDHVDSGEGGGIVSRTVSVEEAAVELQ